MNALNEDAPASASSRTAYSCDECDWTGFADDLDGIADVHERVLMGEFMAAGCCPSCGDLIGVADADVPVYTLEDAERILAQRGTGKAVWLAKLLADVMRTSEIDDAGQVVLKPTQLAIRNASEALDQYRRFSSKT
jgi:hypothetical protein